MICGVSHQISASLITSISILLRSLNLSYQNTKLGKTFRLFVVVLIHLGFPFFRAPVSHSATGRRLYQCCWVQTGLLCVP